MATFNNEKSEYYRPCVEAMAEVPGKSYWDSRYNTADELKFLDGLGNHATTDERAPRRPVMSRPCLLQLYLASMEQRQDWGPMDVKKIRAYALKLLKKG